MIVTRALTKQFGPILAVDRLDLTVATGEVLGFLGPNGAGKSTTMKMITGFLTPTSGTASVRGHDVSKEPLAVKSRIGYLPEGAPLYADMTAAGFLRFIAQVRGLSGRRAQECVDRAVELTQLKGVLRQPIETLSKGFKRRVGLAQAILHDPEVLILDEPTDGLDPNQKHQVRQLIREMAAAGGKAIVLSTHILEEVEAVCSRAIIVAKGRIVADGTPAQLQARSRYHNAVTLTVQAPASALEELARLPGVAGVEDLSPPKDAGGVAGGVGVVRCTVIPKKGEVVAERVSRHAREKGWAIDQLRVESGRLDDVFRQITAA
ncbi:MAG: ABC transporter ATP-binding protein [Phycisphaeraceae bacterium]|nr:MAG: ABC transporter ATP-binding protein [Phycisphaeraceae bacterium]